MLFQTQSVFKNLSVKITELLEEANVHQPPVPIKTIASNCGARVLPYDLGEEVSGILIYEDNKATIGFNSTNHKVRQRFTIAHELGHLIYHVRNNEHELFVDKDFIIKFRSEIEYSAKEKKQEREANAFAAAILMPREFILKEIRKPDYYGMNEQEVIEECAKLFDVSVLAMTYRFADLNINS